MGLINQIIIAIDTQEPRHPDNAQHSGQRGLLNPGVDINI